MSKEVERQLFFKLKELNNIAVNNFSTTFDECSATGVQFAVLRNITADGSTKTMLKEAVNCAASNMTTLIQRMEREGLVHTVKNPDDRRETKVYLTKSGKAVLDSMEPMYQAFLSNLYGGITAEEQKVLDKLLTKLIMNSK